MEKSDFLEEAVGFLGILFDTFKNAPLLPLDSLPKEKTALIIVDMINGFVKEGALASPRVLQINDKIASFAGACTKQGMPIIAFADSHTRKSPEFSSYPVHCLHGSRESALTAQLQAIPNIRRIEKNSLNGYLEKEFQDFLHTNPQLDNFIVTGCCTDLCVQLSCLTLKTAFNKEDRPCRVIVPTEMTATFDLPNHHGDFSDLCAYFNMHVNGIEIIKDITLPRKDTL